MPSGAHQSQLLGRLIDEPAVVARITQRAESERFEVGARDQKSWRRLLDVGPSLERNEGVLLGDEAPGIHESARVEVVEPPRHVGEVIPRDSQLKMHAVNEAVAGHPQTCGNLLESTGFIDCPQVIRRERTCEQRPLIVSAWRRPVGSDC